jgi:hypothetical protein
MRRPSRVGRPPRFLALKNPSHVMSLLAVTRTSLDTTRAIVNTTGDTDIEEGSYRSLRCSSDRTRCY